MNVINIFFLKKKFVVKINKLKAGTILKMKEKDELNKNINKGNYVMLIYGYNPFTQEQNKEKYIGKL